MGARSRAARGWNGMRGRWQGGRTRGSAVLAAALLLAALAPAARAQAPIATAPVVIEGVTLQQVLDAPVPLYATASVAEEKLRWMRDAVATALVEVPRVTGLPLPQSRLEFYLFNDPQELATLSSQLLRSPGPRVTPECFALTRQANTPRRGIYCQADGWASAEEALDYVTHEVTHQVEQGDYPQRRGLAQWFNEGLAEYVQAQVLAERGPAYAARDRWQREARVASALHTTGLFPLRELSSNVRWQQAAGAGWAGLIYAQSALIVGWLADTYGLPAVIEVVRRSGGPFAFDAIFEEVFGISVERAEEEAQSALAADLLPRYPVGLSVFRTEAADGSMVFHFAVVGFQPREGLEKEYRYDNGARAEGRAPAGARPEADRTDRVGFATWAWTSTDSPPPGASPTIHLTVRGSQGSEASQTAPLTP
jgi:hypothetical protein